MEGKLYKLPNGEHYYLTVDGKIFAEIGGHPLKTINQSLSLKNCQAIENGYDLDELLDGLLINRGEHLSRVRNPLYGEERQLAKDLVQKALEILGDKKFSEDDLREAISQTRKGMLYNKQYEDEHIQSLQQTEWDVEVMMEEKRIGGGKGYGEYEIVPELDEDGCLILRRYEN